MRSPAVLLAMLLALGALDARAAQVFNDGEFASWSFGSTASSMATAGRDAAGGNPGARLAISTNTGGGTAYAYGVKTDFSTNAALAGTAFTVNVDVLQGAGTVQAVELIVEQAGTVYRMPIGDTGTPVPTTFATRTYSGTLSAASFARVAGTGPLNPDLGGGVATRFGIAAGNTFSPAQTFYYDNVRLDLGAVAPTDPCAGFSDVIQGDSFCQATIWLKNRGVTTGCSATQYCPTLTLTRAQMALFMQRLGKALAPEVLHKQAQLQNFNLPNESTPPGLLACETGDFATGSYARTASFSGSYYVVPATATVVSQGYWRYSTNGGATWNYVGNWQVDQFGSAATANPGTLASATVLAPPLSLAPNATYRFGLFVNGGNNDGMFGLLLSCQIEVMVLTPP